MMSDEQIEQSGILETIFGDALPKVRAFYEKLKSEGEPRGLIGPRDVDILWERHLLNSAAVVPFIRQATSGKQFRSVADIGSGGGFPGLVAAAMLPDHTFTSRWNAGASGSPNVWRRWVWRMCRLFARAPRRRSPHSSRHAGNPRDAAMPRTR